MPLAAVVSRPVGGRFLLFGLGHNRLWVMLTLVVLLVVVAIWRNRER